jgi:hypothetical protein
MQASHTGEAATGKFPADSRALRSNRRGVVEGVAKRKDGKSKSTSGKADPEIYLVSLVPKTVSATWEV